MSGSPFQFTKSSSVLSIRHIKWKPGNAFWLADSSLTHLLGTFYQIWNENFCWYLKRNFCFRRSYRLRSSPFDRFQKAQPNRNKFTSEEPREEIRIKESLVASKIFAASRISLPIGISLELTICQPPMSWLPASTRQVHVMEFSRARDNSVRFLERTRSLV